MLILFGIDNVFSKGSFSYKKSLLFLTSLKNKTFQVINSVNVCHYLFVYNIISVFMIHVFLIVILIFVKVRNLSHTSLFLLFTVLIF